MALLDLKDVEKVLDVSDKTVRGYINGGLLRAVRLGGRRKIQVRPEDLERFIAESEVVPKSVPASRPKPTKMSRNRQGQKPSNSNKRAWMKAYGHE